MAADSSVGDGLGITSIAVMAIGYAIEWLTLSNINDIIVTVSGAGGLVWLGIKIRGGILDNKIKKKDLEINKED